MDDTVKAYLDSVPDARRERLMKLHDLILKLYPGTELDMSYKMPTYRAGDGWVALANRKNHISLYTCGYHHIAPFKAKHPNIKTGKGCINFRDSDPLPMNDLEKVIRHAISHPKG
jgi:uncharacterized protein YdhG (YjbR/CyaY superfamily)